MQEPLLVKKEVRFPYRNIRSLSVWAKEIGNNSWEIFKVILPDGVMMRGTYFTAMYLLIVKENGDTVMEPPPSTTAYSLFSFLFPLSSFLFCLLSLWI